MSYAQRKMARERKSNIVLTVIPIIRLQRKRTPPRRMGSQNEQIVYHKFKPRDRTAFGTRVEQIFARAIESERHKEVAEAEAFLVARLREQERERKEFEEQSKEAADDDLKTSSSRRRKKKGRKVIQSFGLTVPPR